MVMGLGLSLAQSAYLLLRLVLDSFAVSRNHERVHERVLGSKSRKSQVTGNTLELFFKCVASDCGIVMHCWWTMTRDTVNPCFRQSAKDTRIDSQ